MNRPATANPRSAKITALFTQDVRDRIEKAAADDGRTVSAWIERTVIERLQRDGYLPKAKGKK